MDNSTFVDNLLDQISDRNDINDILEDLKSHYTNGPRFIQDYVSGLIKKIDLRVKDMLDVIDPMWFVVALYHRNKGGLWRDMHKYGVRSNKLSSYKVETPSNGEPIVYTDKFKADSLPTL